MKNIALGFAFIFYLIFGWHNWWAGVAPRLTRGTPEREAIHHSHLSIGGLLFILMIIGFFIWLFKPGKTPMQKLKGSFSNASNAAISTFAISAFLTALYGLSVAWAKDEHISVLGFFDMPQFLNWSWYTSGYMHSAAGTICTIIFSCIVFIYLYKHVKKYMHPVLAVAVVLGIHILINLPKPPSLHPIANISTYVMLPLFYLIAVAVYTWAHDKKWVYSMVLIGFSLFFLYLPAIAFKATPPWHPKPKTNVADPSANTAQLITRSKEQIFMNESAVAAAKETASWCFQCHNMAEGNQELLGPNLVGVFNRLAGSDPDYSRYSSAIINEGKEGLIWDRESLAKFLTDGPAFIPGNSMNQQTDLSDSTKLNQVIDYLEYISTK